MLASTKISGYGQESFLDEAHNSQHWNNYGELNNEGYKHTY